MRLGPILQHWPAGLVLRCALQGDLIAEAEAELLDDAIHDEGPLEMTPTAGMARRVDNLVHLLALAGWDDAAAQARQVRDALLADGLEAEVSVPLARLVRRVRRSRTLRWSLLGLRPLSEAERHRHGLPTSLAGDTYDRLLRMLGALGTAGEGSAVAVDRLPRLVTGLDVATARLVLASLDLHELRSASREREAEHG